MRRSFGTVFYVRAGAAFAGLAMLCAVAAGGVAARAPLALPAGHPYLIPVALGDTEIDADSQTGRYSLLVRQIQLRLAELGLYGGRIGGVMSAETAEAIRTYQRFANLPVDGKPTLDGPSQTLGCEELYLPACHTHYIEKLGLSAGQLHELLSEPEETI